MINHFAIDSLKKIAGVTLMASAIALTGCGDKNATSGGGSGSADRTQYEVEGDHAIGNPNATVTVVEYASVTCGHCANWHNAVWPTLREDYIDTGKVRFVFREFPTQPVRLAEVGFMIARCADEDKYFGNIGLQFERQQALMQAAGRGEAQKAYGDIARAAGLSDEEFEACLANEEEFKAMQDVVRDGFERGVNATPTFFINGEIKKVFTIESFDEEFARLGLETPERESAPTSEGGE